MSLQLDIARSHLETLVERISGVERAVPDAEGDYLVRTEHARFFARVDGDQQPVIRVYSVIAKDVTKTPELLDALNNINMHLSFLRTVWINGQVLMEADLFAMAADTAGFAEACRRVASASDHFGPGLIEHFGGVAQFEAGKDADYSPKPPNYFGYL